MVLVKPSFEILNKLMTGDEILQAIEQYGRVCYKSESKIGPDTARKFVAGIIKSGHESVIEHEKITVKVICDRGVTHEIVRHRIASYSQESTRYCNYKGGVTFVIPPWVNVEPGEYDFHCFPLDPPATQTWMTAMKNSESYYLDLLNNGWSPQQARSVLPNSLKTEIVITYNLREWRHFFKLRTSSKAHPQMREIAIPILERFKQLVPIIFDDIEVS